MTRDIDSVFILSIFKMVYMMNGIYKDIGENKLMFLK